MSIMVSIKKSLKNFYLDASLEIANETVAVLGASGCGKSMLLKCIAGVETPDEGIIVINDTVVFDSKKSINLSPQKRKIGYLFQNYALFPKMTIEENIGAGIGLPKIDKEKIVKEYIKKFFLLGMEEKFPAQISGGQQQRVALARMLATQPQIMMLDEPFSALDSHLRWKLEQEMMQVLSDFGGTSIFVSHNRGEVYRLCQRVAVMGEGKIESIHEKERLFQRPQTLNGALLTGCKNISRAKKISAYIVEALDWGVTLETEEPVMEDIRYIGIRAHYFKYRNSENMLGYKIEKIIDNTFTKIIVMRPKDSEQENEFSYLRWEVPMKRWKEIEADGGELLLGISKKDIMQLR